MGGQNMETSQTKEQSWDLKNLIEVMTPITPIKTRSRSQEKERQTINTAEITKSQERSRSRSQEQKRQTKNTTENGNNQDKNHLAGTQRNSKASNKGKNQKLKINNKPKEN